MNRTVGALLFLTLLAGICAISGGAAEGTEFIVVLRENQDAGRINRSYGTTTVRQVEGTSVYLLRSVDGSEQQLNRIRSDQSVEVAERNSKLRLQESTQASGPVGDDAFPVVGPETTNFFGVEVPRFYAGQPALSRIQADSAWSLSSGAGARIAYIDTGVDPGHPALAPWVEPGVDLVNGVSASEFDGLSAETMYLLDTDRTIPLGAETMFLLDRRFSFLFDRSLISTLAGASEQAVPPAFGHGTLVAGVLHAVAPEARIVPIKAFDAYGNTTLFTIVEAVHRAVDMDVDVLNMSFSTRVSSEALRRAVLRAYGAGIGMAASAGNEGANMQDVYPAAYNMVFAVSATDLNDRLAAFSNYGKLVAVSAPGVAVVSTVPGGRYGAAWGTSFGAPMVSGAMALRAARFPQGQSVARIVVNSADAIDELNPAFKGELGTGRLNVRRALER